MTKNIAVGLALFLGLNAAAGIFGLGPALACNKTGGCIMDNILENYDMMHSNKMNDAMTAGKENMESFRKLREIERSRKFGASPVDKKW